MIERIIFWTEAGKNIGLGHIKRCLACAKYFRKKKIKNSFITNNDNYVDRLIKKEGFNTVSLRNIKDTVDNNTLVFFDTKEDVSEEILSLKQNGIKVLLLDNLSKARLYSDVVVMPGAHFRMNIKGKYNYGAKFFPLDEEFLKRYRKRKAHKKLNLLVSFGGVDPNNLTIKVIKILKDYLPDIKITVVVGPYFKYKKEIKEIIKRLNRRFIFKVGDSLAKVAHGLDAAITAFGVSLYEFSYLGIPSIIIANYKDDKKWAEILDRIGMSVYLGYYQNLNRQKLYSAIDYLHKPDILSSMSTKCKRIIDGKGTERIYRIIRALK